MPSYSFDDDKPRFKRPGMVDNPSDREFAEYAEFFSSFIHHTKCSLCNKFLPCLPMHLPFYREEVFVCVECVYVIHEHLAAFGYLEQLMSEDIYQGKIREQQGEDGGIVYVPTNDPSLVPAEMRSLLDDEVPIQVDEEVVSEYDLPSLIEWQNEVSPSYEEGYLAVDFSTFSKDCSIFDESFPPDESSRFVSEVIMRKRLHADGYEEWVDLIPANDPIRKQDFFRNHLSASNPPRLFRGVFQFFVNLFNWIDATEDLPHIQLQLEDQLDAVTKLISWLKQKKVVITSINTRPSQLFFTTTVDLFSDVLAHPAIDYQIDPNEIAILSFED